MAALAVGMTVDFNGSGKYSKAPYACMPGVIVAVNADRTKCQLKWDIKGKWDEMPGRTMLLSECTLHAAGDAGMTTPAKQRPPVASANFSDPVSPVTEVATDEPEREKGSDESDGDDDGSDEESDDEDVGDGSLLARLKRASEGRAASQGGE